MSQIQIVYHSGYGHTKKVAEQIVEGTAGLASLVAISAEGIITDAQWQALDAAKMIVFGSPTYMGGPSWQFKKFADATSKVWFKMGWKNKWASGFTNSASMNGDKLSTLHYFVTLSQQHGMYWVGTGMMPSNQKASKRDDLNYVASFVGLMTTTPADAGVDEMNAGDFATARAYGKRLIETLQG